MRKKPVLRRYRVVDMHRKPVKRFRAINNKVARDEFKKILAESNRDDLELEVYKDGYHKGFEWHVVRELERSGPWQKRRLQRRKTK